MDCSKLSKVFGIERFHCTSKHVVTHTEQYGCIQLQSMCTARHGRLPTTHTTLHQPPSPLVPHTLTSFAYTTCVYILVNMHTYTCTFTCIHACMYALVWGSQYINRHHISSQMRARLLACCLTTIYAGPLYSFVATRAPSMSDQSCLLLRASRPTGERTPPDPSSQL